MLMYPLAKNLHHPRGEEVKALEYTIKFPLAFALLCFNSSRYLNSYLNIVVLLYAEQLIRKPRKKEEEKKYLVATEEIRKRVQLLL